MNQKLEKYLPIGTVVLLNGASKRLMITGFCSTAPDENDRIYDYVGCVYPEGVLSNEEIALFNHNQIVSIYHMGLIDQEEQNFKLKLNSVMSQVNSMQQISSVNDATKTETQE